MTPDELIKVTLERIAEFLRERSYPPTIDELMELVGVRGKQTMVNTIKKLERKGLVERERGTARGMKITPSGEEVLQQIFAAEGKVPMLGHSAGGAFTPSEEGFEELLEVESPEVSRLKDTFVIQVHGDSMTEAGINDGDFVLVKSQNYASNGDIVLALSEGETTVKRYIERGRKIYLKPENPSQQEFEAPKDLQIQGVIIDVIRRGT